MRIMVVCRRLQLVLVCTEMQVSPLKTVNWGLLVQLGTKSVCNTLNDESVAKVSVSVGHVGVKLRELQDFCVHSIVKVYF